MQLNIVRPFMPDLAELSAEFAQCLQTGMVNNNLKPVFCDVDVRLVLW
jgi:hypothetical protein